MKGNGGHKAASPSIDHDRPLVRLVTILNARQRIRQVLGEVARLTAFTQRERDVLQAKPHARRSV